MIPATRRIRYLLEFAGFLLVSGFFRVLPIEAASAFSGWCWRVLAPLTHRHGRAVANLRRAFPEKDEEACERIARDMWENLGRNFGESFHLFVVVRSDRIVIEPEALAQLKTFSGAGAVICGAHQGNWEVMGIAAMREGLKPAGIYQRIKNPYVDAWLRKARAPFYPGGLMPKNRKAGLQLMRHVQHGGCMVLLADLRDFNGIRVPFFGQPAPANTFPALVARTLDVPLFAWFNAREPGVRFRLWGEQIEVPRTDDKEADIAAATANLQAAFERTIRERPAEWMWGHRRWG